MAATNTLVGDYEAEYGADASDFSGYAMAPQSAYGVRDGTEILVALIVLGAVAILAGFHLGGFRSIITVGR